MNDGSRYGDAFGNRVVARLLPPESACVGAVAIALVLYLALMIASIAAMPWLVDSDRIRFNNVLSVRR